MTMQARFDANDPRLYAVERDVAHNFGSIAKIVASRLEHPQRWPALDNYMRSKGFSYDDKEKSFVAKGKAKITDEELGRACKAYITFVASAAKYPEEDMSGTLERSGWNKVSEEAQFCVMAVLGSVMLGVYWAGARDATLDGKGPCSTLGYLHEHADRAAFLLTSPRLLRGCYRILYELRQTWRALRSTRS